MPYEIWAQGFLLSLDLRYLALAGCLLAGCMPSSWVPLPLTLEPGLPKVLDDLNGDWRPLLWAGPAVGTRHLTVSG